MKKYVLLLFLCVQQALSMAQELNARVQVQAPQISNLNNRQIESLQKSIQDFLNLTKWTNESYQVKEKIDCTFTITLSQWDGNAAYSAEALIQSSRPIFGTSYQSTLLNISDKDFDFNYNAGQILDYSDQNYILNLSSMLAYYAYTIIGLDKDSFSELGGSSYFQKAQSVLNQAQMSGSKGWKANDGLRNRFWLNENLLNPNFQALRKYLYQYHFNVLDLMSSQRLKALEQLKQAIQQISTLDKQKIGAYFPNVYLVAKAEETAQLIQLLAEADRSSAIQVMSQIDPANINKYTANTPPKPTRTRQ